MKTTFISTATLLALFCLAIPAKGQVNNSVLFGKHFGTVGANTQPAMLGKNIDNFEINLLNTYAWAGNTAMDWGTLKKFFDDPEIEADAVDEALDNLEENNLLTAGVNSNPFSLAVKIKKDEEELFTFSLGSHVRVLTNLQFSKALPDIVWNGNRKYRGESVNLGPIKANALPVREYSLGVAAPLSLGKDTVKIRPGFRVRYIQGLAAFYTERGNMELFTHKEAREIEFTANYKFHKSLDSLDIDEVDPFDTRGTGIGIDVGVNTRISEKWSLGVSVADIGNVNFTEEVTNYSKKQTRSFEGINVDIVQSYKNERAEIDADSVEQIIEPEESNNDFKMPLGTRLILQGEYRTGKFEKGDNEYYHHHVFLLYQQGFSNHLIATKRPYVAAGYTYNVGNVLNVGTSFSTGGYNRFTFGPYFSLNAGAFKFGLGSNNILPLVNEDLGTGLDASFNMALSF